MKKIALATAFSLAASTAFAGNMEAPMMDAPVVEESSSSSGGLLLPLIILVAVWAATR
jgi:hypothetical protein